MSKSGFNFKLFMYSPLNQSLNSVLTFPVSYQLKVVTHVFDNATEDIFLVSDSTDLGTPGAAEVKVAVIRVLVTAVVAVVVVGVTEAIVLLFKFKF